MTRQDPEVDAIDLRTGVAITGSGVAAYITIKPLLAGSGVPTAITILSAQLAIIVAIVIGGRGPHLASRLGLRPAAMRFYVAAVLVGASAWVVDTWVTRWIVTVLGPPTGALAPDLGLISSVIIIGLLAPLVEELLFRGVLVRSLATRWSRPATIAVSALAFAVVHQSPFRFVPPLLIGSIAAYLTLRAGSIVPAMIIHALNNTLLVLYARGANVGVMRWTIAHIDALAAPAAVMMLAGVALASIGERRGARRATQCS